MFDENVQNTWGEKEVWGEDEVWRDNTYFNPMPPKEMAIGKQEDEKRAILNDQDEHSSLIVGGTGSGKTRYLLLFIWSLIRGFFGKCGALILCPHPDLFFDLLLRCTGDPALAKRVVLFNPSEADQDGKILGFHGSSYARDFVDYITDTTVEMIFRVFGENPNDYPRLRKWLRLSLYPMFACGYPFVMAEKLFYDRDFRHEVLAQIDNEQIIYEWTQLDKIKNSVRIDELSEGVRNRLAPFTSSPPIFKMLSADRVLDLSRAMDEGLIVLCKLTDEAPVSAKAAQFLGSMLIDAVLQCGRKRDLSKPLKPFHVIIDEFPVFRGASTAIAAGLDQLRKFKTFFHLATQTLERLREEDEMLYHSVMSGCKTKLIFGSLSREDGEALARQLFSGFLEYHMIKYDQMGIRTRLTEVMEELEIEALTEDVSSRYSIGSDYCETERQSEATDEATIVGDSESKETGQSDESGTATSKETSSSDEEHQGHESFQGTSNEHGTQTGYETSQMDKTSVRQTTGFRTSDQCSSDHRSGNGVSESQVRVAGQSQLSRSQNTQSASSRSTRHSDDQHRSQDTVIEHAVASKQSQSRFNRHSKQQGSKDTSGLKHSQRTAHLENSSSRHSESTRHFEVHSQQQQTTKRKSDGRDVSDSKKSSVDVSAGLRKTVTKTKTKTNKPEEVSELSKRTFYSLPELWEMRIGELMNQVTGQATLKIGGNAPLKVKISDVKDPYFDPIRSPLAIKTFKQSIFEAHPEFYNAVDEAEPETVDSELGDPERSSESPTQPSAMEREDNDLTLDEQKGGKDDDDCFNC